MSSQLDKSLDEITAERRTVQFPLHIVLTVRPRQEVPVVEAEAEE